MLYLRTNAPLWRKISIKLFHVKTGSELEWMIVNFCLLDSPMHIVPYFWHTYFERFSVLHFLDLSRANIWDFLATWIEQRPLIMQEYHKLQRKFSMNCTWIHHRDQLRCHREWRPGNGYWWVWDESQFWTILTSYPSNSCHRNIAYHPKRC